MKIVGIPWIVQIAIIREIEMNIYELMNIIIVMVRNENNFFPLHFEYSEHQP